jgi:hypothetical protein
VTPVNTTLIRFISLVLASAPLPLLAVGCAPASPSHSADVFNREAGPADAPVLLLLHGFPASSHQSAS